MDFDADNWLSELLGDYYPPEATSDNQPRREVKAEVDNSHDIDMVHRTHAQDTAAYQGTSSDLQSQIEFPALPYSDLFDFGELPGPSHSFNSFDSTPFPGKAVVPGPSTSMGLQNSNNIPPGLAVNFDSLRDPALFDQLDDPASSHGPAHTIEATTDRAGGRHYLQGSFEDSLRGLHEGRYQLFPETSLHNAPEFGSDIHSALPTRPAQRDIPQGLSQYTSSIMSNPSDDHVGPSLQPPTYLPQSSRGAKRKASLMEPAGRPSLVVKLKVPSEKLQAILTDTHPASDKKDLKAKSHALNTQAGKMQGNKQKQSLIVKLKASPEKLQKILGLSKGVEDSDRSKVDDGAHGAGVGKM